jgi:hypothetical protein
MLQVSLVGYWVGGAFLSHAYYDVPYFLLVAVAVVSFVGTLGGVTFTRSRRK